MFTSARSGMGRWRLSWLRRTRHLFAVSLPVSLTAGLLSVVSAPGAVQAAAPGSAWDEASAKTVALQSGERVEVASRRSETRQVFANPDGTFSLEESVTAQRARGRDGNWHPINTELEVLGDGSLRPKSAVTSVVFSGGGDAPLASLIDGERRLSVRWPAELPKPVVEGASATYAEVLSGVDLRVTAQAEGFSQVLVVKNAEAAANPQLRSLRFGLETSNLQVGERGAGGAEARDVDGNLVFESPTPMMWDSSGSAVGVTGRSAVEEPAVEPQYAQMPTEVAADSLTIAPDQELLTSADTVYPVFIDPSWSGGKLSNAWTSVWQSFPSSSFWQNASTSSDTTKGMAKVGRYGGSSEVIRSLFRMSISGVTGKHILDAKFRIQQRWSWTCNPATNAKLWLTGGISSSTTWNDQPTWGIDSLTATTLGDRAEGSPYGCRDVGDIEFDATAMVDKAVDSGWPSLTVGLRAGSETTNDHWKRFNHDSPKLVVTYNSYPSVPTSLSPEGRGCATGAARPNLGQANPTLRAKVNDPDIETDLKLSMAWERQNPTTLAWSALGAGTQSNLKNNDTGQVKITTALVNDGVYRFRAQTLDPYSGGTDSSAWSGWCEFRVDLVGPAVAPEVTSADYGPDLDQTYGAVGKTGTFTFGAAGVADVIGYKYGWEDPPTTSVSVPAGAAVSVPMTPPAPSADAPTQGGEVKLFVQSFDASGSTSPLTAYTFNLGGATGPLADLPLDEPAGSPTLADATGNGFDLTTGGVTTGVPGRILDGPGQIAGTAARFDGIDDVASSGGPVVDTSTSFTVSAWAKLAATSAKSQQLVSADGAATGGFGLWWSQVENRWAFVMAESDTNNVSRPRAVSLTAPVVGKWTYLVGVYDKATKQMTLYIDGVKQQSTTLAGGFKANGSLVLGRGIWNGTPVDYFNGELGGVKVWDRVLSEQEIAPMTASLVSHWKLDTDLTDATDYARELSVNGSVEWNYDRLDNQDLAAKVYSATDGPNTAGPVLRTDQSYTVAAWVRLDSASSWSTALAQRGNITSGLLVQYDKTNNKWVVGTQNGDWLNPAGTRARSVSTPVVGEWTHLVGVHDAARQQLRLYVNGSLEATVALTAPWHAAGPMLVGVEYHQNGYGSRFNGALDDVRIYSGVVPDARIAKIASSN